MGRMKELRQEYLDAIGAAHYASDSQDRREGAAHVRWMKKQYPSLFGEKQPTRPIISEVIQPPLAHAPNLGDLENAHRILTATLAEVTAAEKAERTAQRKMARLLKLPVVVCENVRNVLKASTQLEFAKNDLRKAQLGLTWAQASVRSLSEQLGVMN